MGLETVEIIMEIEDHFHVDIPDAVASRCDTVADLQKAVIELLLGKGNRESADLELEVYAGVISVIGDLTKIPPEKIRLESRLIGEITRHG